MPGHFGSYYLYYYHRILRQRIFDKDHLRKAGMRNLILMRLLILVILALTGRL
jgi:hypothetical protein